ncbi:MAG: chorismate synthase [Chthonomonadales bacterium]
MLRFMTGGESHGPALSAIVEGLPAGLTVDFDEINRQLRRRQGGYGRGARQQIEKDRVEIVSGVRLGRTLGSPITLLVRNRDFENWLDRMSVEPREGEPPPVVEARPGHADFAGMLKYATNDLRNILERSSARNTVSLVAVGALCRGLLRECSIRIMSHVTCLGGIQVELPEPVDYAALERAAEASPVRVADAAAEKRILAAIDEAGARGDTLGGVFEVVALGCPPGLGSHASWDRRLDGRLAGALMGIQAIKGVEIGMGFGVAWRPGSQVHDEIFPTGGHGFMRRTNNAGGLEGGMTNGEPVVVRAAMKPLSTLKKPLRSVNMQTGEAVQAHFERSDVCAVPAAAVIGEAMVAIVLAEAVLEKFGGDSMEELLRNLSGYREAVGRRGYRP